MEEEYDELQSYRVNMPHLLVRLNDLCQQKQVLARQCLILSKTVADGKNKIKALVTANKKGGKNHDLSISDIINRSMDSGVDID